MKNMYDKICRQCGSSFLGGPRAFYCPACRDIRRKEHNARFAAKGKADRPIGSTDKCKVCGGDYIVNSARQIYCCACAPDRYKAVDRVQGLDYYVNNKEHINLYRAMTRYQDGACVVCGRLFKSKTRRFTCSSDCHRAYINKWHRDHRS